MSANAIDLATFFTTDLDAQSYEQFLDLSHASFGDLERFAELLNEYRAKTSATGIDALRAGLGLLILGRFSEALEVLAKAPAGKIRHYYAAHAAIALHRYDEALEEFKQSAAKGWDAFEIDMETATLHVRMNNVAAAEKLVAKHETAGKDRAAWHFVRGLIAEAKDEYGRAIDLYEKALTLDPDHSQAMFRAAWLYDLRGEDEQAIEHYERLALQPRAYVNALINIAVIYEDLGKYDLAAECLERILRVYPNDARARLFLKDVRSCQQMVIEDGVREMKDPRQRLLEQPIPEEELSVRARNCLKKMKVHTFGELIRLSEPELLAYKNFGETSLNEIKALLTKKGLRLGQNAEEIEAPELPEPPPVVPAVAKPVVPPGREAILFRPVSELELSVRARRCLQRLNVNTLGDLIQYTEADLLATRNFGQTSLNEVKGRLTEMGLGLATKPGE